SFCGDIMSIEEVCDMIKKLLMLLMTVLLMSGCSGSSDEPSKDTSIANPLSSDARDCANVVNVLLNQRLHYKNDAAENLTRKAALTVHGNPFPLNETDENFGRYNKAALRENLRSHFMHCSRFDDRRLSYTTADEIASAFSDLIDTTTYEVTPSGKTVELDGEYQELDVHIEYPDIDAINRRALENLNAALKSKYGVGSSDPDKIIAEKDRHGFEKLDRLLEYGYAFADHWTSSTQTSAQHAEFDAIVRDAYLSVLSDKNDLPIKTYNGTIHIAKRNAKGAVNYMFWDKDESLLPLNIDIWTPLAAPNEHLALDSGARDVLTLAVRDVRFDGSNAMDVSIFVNNKTDEDIVLQYDVCDAYDKSLGWQWLSPNNQYIPLDGQEFVLSKGDSKTVDWKLQSGSVSGDPFMFRINVMSRDFNGYIYAPLTYETAARPSTPQQSVESPVENKSTVGEIAPGRKLGADDLRLGDIEIEEDTDSVLKKLGNPDDSDISNPNGDIILHYGKPSPRMDITINPTTNDWAEMIVAVGADVSTPRGLKPSSAVGDVTSFYGVGYKKSQYENLDLYEYEIESRSGAPCILRFAVNQNDNRVNYISIRHK
ncbi:MAG: hypothetical protein IJU71_05435, partial [Selenomonadaceae bacterium]|nr:hypothetical protein [Selenomonadaceae bacterium]